MSVQPPDQLENEEVLRIFREIDKSPEMTRRKLSSRLATEIQPLREEVRESGFPSEGQDQSGNRL